MVDDGFDFVQFPCYGYVWRVSVFFLLFPLRAGWHFLCDFATLAYLSPGKYMLNPLTKYSRWHKDDCLTQYKNNNDAAATMGIPRSAYSRANTKTLLAQHLF